MRVGLALVLCCVGTAGLAEAVERSPRPMANPLYVVAGVAGQSMRPMPRPMPRPAGLMVGLTGGAEELPLVTEDLAAAAPPPAAPLTRKELRKAKRAAVDLTGSVCGVPAIKGEVIAPITSSVPGCGVAEPVRVTSVSGVRFSEFPTIDCGEAVALNTWVRDVVQPAFGGKVVELQVAAHYVCRGRNGIKGAKISEHGKGKAVDISAFVLAGGKVLTVAQNYRGVIRKVHKAACGIFRTTLGPGSDGYHETHLHLDTSGRKGGAYCR